MATAFKIIVALLALASVVALIISRIKAKHNLSRSLNMVFLAIRVPLKDSKEVQDRAVEKDMKEVNDVMTHFFESIHSIYNGETINKFTGEDFFSCEYVVLEKQLQFFVVIPSYLRSLFDKQITAFYPDIFVEQVPDYNIFRKGYKASGMYMKLKKENAFPIRTYQFTGSDPLNNMTNAFSGIESDEGVAVQLMLRPLGDGWQEKGREMAQELHQGKGKKPKSLAKMLNPITWIMAIVNAFLHGSEEVKPPQADPMARTTQVMDEQIKLMETKNTKVGFESVIRIVASAKNKNRVKQILNEIKSAFAQYNAPNNNGLKDMKYFSRNRLLKGFVMRDFKEDFWGTFFRSHRMILCAEEVASIFHFPDVKYNKSPVIKWQEFKIAPPPSNLPEEGLFLGNSVFRGVTKPVYFKKDDRRRHLYIIGKSGTGKSTILSGMFKQDLNTKDGVCLIDPHGDLVEQVLPHIPRDRADDVILFDPGDLGRPMGLNILEAKTQDEKEFISQEALAIFIKMFGEEIMGPRLQHYFRNGCLTLMEDDAEGATLLDLPRLFTDEPWQKFKVTKVKNPVVRAFWEKEMAMTGQREKQEMIPYFSSKFGPFITNAQIRNIIGQTKSGFNFRKVMDGQRILLCNLSKGKLGDLNAKLLGMIMVAKLQMAAMSRVDTPEDERHDFYMYVDEFQNFVTDSFASILSEARKYRLCLIIAHQYISQITKLNTGKGSQEDTTIKDAVFGNVGSMMNFKIGAEDAEYMAKEFAPIFTAEDLVNIANYQAYIKLNINNATSRGFSMSTVYDPDKGDLQAAEAFRQLSRLKNARDREFVEREIMRRVGMTDKKTPPKTTTPPAPNDKAKTTPTPPIPPAPGANGTPPVMAPPATPAATNQPTPPAPRPTTPIPAANVAPPSSVSPAQPQASAPPAYPQSQQNQGVVATPAAANNPAYSPSVPANVGHVTPPSAPPSSVPTTRPPAGGGHGQVAPAQGSLPPVPQQAAPQAPSASPYQAPNPQPPRPVQPQVQVPVTPVPPPVVPPNPNPPTPIS